MSKGIASIIVVVMGGAALTILAMIALILPIFTLRVHFIETVNYESGYNNAQLALTTLLVSTDESGKPVREIFADYIERKIGTTTAVTTNIAGSQNIAGTVAKDKLDKLKQNGILNCYELKIGNEIIIPSGGCETKYSAQTVIAAPYNDFTKIITLAIA